MREEVRLSEVDDQIAYRFPSRLLQLPVLVEHTLVRPLPLPLLLEALVQDCR